MAEDIKKETQSDSTAENRKKLIKSGFLMIVCLILIALFLWLLLTRGWFAVPSSSKAPVSVDVQKVKYTVQNADKELAGDNIFTPRFYTDDNNDSYDNREDEGEDINATGIDRIVKYDDTTAVVSDRGSDNPVSIGLYASIRFRAILIPENATDHETWKSSNEEYATVSKYGRVRGLKPTNTPIQITATINGVSKSFYVTVSVIEGENTDLSYVPANTNILKNENKMVVLNHSTVNSKLRAKITVTYKSLDDNNVDTEVKHSRKISDVKEKIGGTSLTWDYQGSGPLDQKSTNWQKYSKPRGYFTLLDQNGYAWDITEMYMSDAQFNNLTSSNYKNVSYINQLNTVLYFGTTNTQDKDDYGDVVPAVATANADTGDAIDAFTSIFLTDAYTSFSTQKGLAINVTFQSRQADYFVTNSSGNGSEDGWFDVYTCDFGQ